MGQTSTKTEQLEWRRNKVNELAVKGYSLTDISRMLSIPKSTIFRDIEYLKEIANETIRNHFQKKLPYEYTKCISGLEEIIKEGWIIATNADKIGNTKDKLQSLALIKDTYNTKMDLLTNASLLQDSIKFVEEQQQNSLLSNNNKNKEIDSNSSDDIQGSTEDYPDKESTTISNNYNQVY